MLLMDGWTSTKVPKEKVQGVLPHRPAGPWVLLAELSALSPRDSKETRGDGGA